MKRAFEDTLLFEEAEDHVERWRVFLADTMLSARTALDLPALLRSLVVYHIKESDIC